MKKFSNDYLEILKGELAGLNLTRILDENEFYEKQIHDSILPLEKSEIFKQSIVQWKRVIDVGFGGGFPIVPLAHILTDVMFVGFELRNKKVQAVKLICNRLGVNNCHFFHQDISKVEIDVPVVITLKAVGVMGEYLKKLHNTAECRVFFYKGPSYQEEVKKLKSENDWKMIEEAKIYDSPTATRYLIGFERKNVPRRTTPSLVKASTFF